MTLAGILRVAWSHRACLALPVVAATVVAALVGWALERRVRYRAVLALEITQGAEAEAVFACTSRKVLLGAIERANLQGQITEEGLLESTAVELAGENLLKLSVTHPVRERAAQLAGATAEEAATAVRARARGISQQDEERIRTLAVRSSDAQMLHESAQRKLAELRTTYPCEIGPHGDVTSLTRARLTETRAALATARRERAEAQAVLAAARARLDDAPPAPAPEAPRVADDPATRALRQRLAQIDRDLESLRAEFTDLHPRVAALIAERERVETSIAQTHALPARAPAAPAREVDRILLEREEQASRAASRVAALEGEESALAEHVRTTAAEGEKAVRGQVIELRDAARNAEDCARALETARRAAAENRASRAAIVVRQDRPPVEVLRTGVSAGPFALGGALLGLIVGALLAALAEALDPILRSDDDLRRHVEIPVLAVVSRRRFGPAAGARGSGVLGALVWLAAFLLVAALLLLLVYPGWDQLRTLVTGRAGGSAPAGAEARP